jgi:hypothetical protein
VAVIRQSSFHGGEVAQNLQSRTDIPSRAAAVRTLRNFFATPTGAAMNRPGFQYVGATKSSATKSRLIPFTFSTTQSYVLEFGHLYVRVIQGGGFVLDALLAPVDVVTPYAEAQLSRLQFVQSGDTLTITHPSHAPRELRRVSQSSWTLASFAVVRSISAPTASPYFFNTPQTVADPTHVTKEWDWVVTAVKDDEESLPSPVLSSAAVVVAPDRAVTLFTDGVAGATSYCWYRGRYGVYGYVGKSNGVRFQDEGQVPNYSDRPPSARDPFASSENPAVVVYHQQRLVMANQPSYPQRVVASRVGAPKNFDYSLPQKDDDAIDFTVSSRQYEEVRALVSMRHLLVLTANTEFAADAGDRPMSPTNINLVPASFNGCSWLRPLVVNNVVLYLQSQQSTVRELAFDGQRGGWDGGEVSLVANHLLASAGRTIVDWTFQRLPYPIMWGVRDDGSLVSMTYSREMNVAAWAKHDTQGTFESVCSIPEGSEDVVYAIVLRNGVRQIERSASRQVTDIKLGCFLDASIWQHSASATTIVTGLAHLEGRSVVALADGIVRGTLTVNGGVITLPVAASDVCVGLSYQSDIELLDLDLDQRDRPSEVRNVSRVTWEVDRTAGLYSGESLSDLTPWRAPLGFTAATLGLYNERLDVSVSSSWNRGGRAALRQSDPLPVTVLGASREVEVGGA